MGVADKNIVRKTRDICHRRPLRTNPLSPLETLYPSSTTVVEHVLSWCHIISFSGGWNYGTDPGPSAIASRADGRHRAGMAASADERGAPDWGTVSPLGC